MLSRTILATSLCALLPFPAFADAANQVPTDTIVTSGDESGVSAEPTAEPETIIVIGRADRPMTVTPRGLSVSLGATDFQSVNATNVEDLMKYAPNFFVRKRYIGDLNGVPGFRGTHSTQSARTLVMVDGFVVSNFIGNSFGFAPKWGVVGPGDVRQFDIVYGPYSSRYNGHSMGGIVSITTREPEAGEAFATAQVFTQPYRQYGTDDTYSGWTVEAGASLAPDMAPWRARASWRHFENTGQPQSWFQMTSATGAAGTPVTGAVIDPDLIVKTPIFAAQAAPVTVQDQFKFNLALDLADGWTASALGMAWFSSTDTDKPESYLRDGNGQPVFTGRIQFDGRPWTLPAVNLGLSERAEYLTGVRLEGDLAGWDTRLNLSRYWVGKGESLSSTGYSSGISNGAGTVTEQHDVGWTTFDALAEREFDDLTLALGGQMNRYSTTEDVFSTTAWRTANGATLTASTGGESSLSGLFAEVRYQVNEDLALTAGLRQEWWRAEEGQRATRVGGNIVTQRYADRSDEATTGSASASWNFAPDWTAQLSLATATRFPTVTELFQGRLLSDGSFDLQSFDPNLKPEQSRDANLLIRRQFETARLTGSIFWQEVDDSIFSFQGFNQNGVIVSSFKNIDQVQQRGAEVIFEATDVMVEGLSLDLNVAWIDAKTVSNPAFAISEGQPFPRIPNWRINGTARYRFAPQWMATVGVRYNNRPTSNLEGTQRGDTFGYASEQLIADARLLWDVTETTTIAFGIDNINNDSAWAFHPFPQRTFMLELKWKR
jgi:iron complex outermembrane recepter protein